MTSEEDSRIHLDFELEEGVGVDEVLTDLQTVVSKHLPGARVELIERAAHDASEPREDTDRAYIRTRGAIFELAEFGMAVGLHLVVVYHFWKQDEKISAIMDKLRQFDSEVRKARIMVSKAALATKTGSVPIEQATEDDVAAAVINPNESRSPHNHDE